MKEYKTISQVLKTGQISVNGPVTIIMVALPILSIFLSPFILPKEYVAVGVLVGTILGFVFAWLWWSYKIVKWKIWAFDNTKKTDWSSLKHRAVSQKLIWEDGSIFQKTEIRSTEDNRKLKNIELEISQIESEKREDNYSLDKVKDDPQIPSIIEYSFKRTETILSAFLPVLLIVSGLYLISIDKLIIGILTLGMAVYYTDLSKIGDIWKKEVQFSIGDKGIDLKMFKQFKFVKWNDTQNISINSENGKMELMVNVKNEFHQVTINLNDYKVGDYDEFLRKINIYLKRSMNK